MLSKKEPPAPPPVPAYGKELEYLYARRQAIDTLIDSLEEYDRYRETRQPETERRMA